MIWSVREVTQDLTCLKAWTKKKYLECKGFHFLNSNLSYCIPWKKLLKQELLTFSATDISEELSAIIFIR